MATWDTHAVALKRYPLSSMPHTRQALEYLLHGLDGLVRGTRPTIEECARTLTNHPGELTTDTLLQLLRDFEKLVMSVSLQVLDTVDCQGVYNEIHQLCSDLLVAVSRRTFFPMHPLRHSRANRTPVSASPLARFLADFSDSPLVEGFDWIALVNLEGNRVVDAVSIDRTQHGLAFTQPTAHDYELLERMRRSERVLHALIGSRWELVAPATDDAWSLGLFRYLTRWLRLATEFATSARGTASSDASMNYEQILEFDEHLLCSRDLADVFQSVAVDVCKIEPFRRSALFLYNPLTQSIEGVYAHNLDLAEVLQIRESQRTIPMLRKVMSFSKPVYFADVTLALPEHYTEHFRLSSLVVTPLRSVDGQTIGVLLVDNNGKRFSTSDAVLATVDELVRRTALAVDMCLSQPGPTLPSPALSNLTTRELEVLQLVAEGTQTKDVAEKLHISEYTVTEHLTSIYRKLDVRNRVQAVAKAIREGVIR